MKLKGKAPQLEIHYLWGEEGKRPPAPSYISPFGGEEKATFKAFQGRMFVRNSRHKEPVGRAGLRSPRTL